MRIGCVVLMWGFQGFEQEVLSVLCLRVGRLRMNSRKCTGDLSAIDIKRAKLIAECMTLYVQSLTMFSKMCFRSVGNHRINGEVYLAELWQCDKPDDWTPTRYVIRQLQSLSSTCLAFQHRIGSENFEDLVSRRNFSETDRTIAPLGNVCRL